MVNDMVNDRVNGVVNVRVNLRQHSDGLWEQADRRCLAPTIDQPAVSQPGYFGQFLSIPKRNIVVRFSGCMA